MLIHGGIDIRENFLKDIYLFEIGIYIFIKSIINIYFILIF